MARVQRMTEGAHHRLGLGVVGRPFLMRSSHDGRPVRRARVVGSLASLLGHDATLARDGRSLGGGRQPLPDRHGGQDNRVREVENGENGQQPAELTGASRPGSGRGHHGRATGLPLPDRS